MSRSQGAIASLLALVLSLQVHAGDAVSSLVALLQPMENLQGSFQQTVTDSQGEVVQESRGSFTMSRPGLLRWQTNEPFPQLLVVNGEAIWLYDEDLEQASRRALGNSLEDTPILLLTGDTADVAQRYRVEQQQDGERQRFTLSPKDTGSSQAGILSWSIAFENGHPQEMTIIDTLNQTTRIALHRLQVNQRGITADTFRFTPPPGTDVIDGSATSALGG